MNFLLPLLTKINGITCHSADIRPGYLFVAIKGHRSDGNRFAEEAYHNGAAAIISDFPNQLPPLPIPVIAVENARQALAFLANHFYQCPSEKLSITGVTGTNGKTTISYMLCHIFRCASKRCGLIGTVHIDFGGKTVPSQLTTPDPLTLNHSLAEMCRQGLSHAAIEVSAQGMQMHRTDFIKLSCGILSNICPDHLDCYHDLSNYVLAKLKFLALLPPTTPFIINISDPNCRDIQRLSTGYTITAGFSPKADIWADIIYLGADCSKFYLTISRPLVTTGNQWLKPQSFLLDLPLPGKHNIENALLAAAGAMLQDISAENVQKALRSFTGVERRMNLFDLNDVTVIDDTALNPGSIEAVFSSISNMSFNRLVVINAIRGNRGPAINAVNAQSLSEWQLRQPFELIVTSGNDCVDAKNQVTPEEKQAFISVLRQNNSNFSFVSSLPAAVSHALSIIQPHDLLVLLGAQGMDQGRSILETIYTCNPPCPQEGYLAAN